MTDELKHYVPMTDEEVRDHMHVAVILNIGKLPQLKGRGKAEADKRRSGLLQFAEALAATLSQSVFIKRPGWTIPSHSATHGHREPPARERK